MAEMTNLAGGAAQAFNAGASVVPDLSGRIQALMSTVMQQEGETQRTGMTNAAHLEASKLAAGYTPGPGGQLEKPTAEKAMKDYAEVINQLGPDEDVTIKGPDFQITRKGRKAPSDFDLHKLAVQEAGKAFANFNVPAKPDGTDWTMDEYRDFLFKQYKTYYTSLEQSKSASAGAPAAAGAPSAAPSATNLSSGVGAGTGAKTIVRTGMLANGDKVAELSDGSIWNLTQKIRMK